MRRWSRGSRSKLPSWKCSLWRRYQGRFRCCRIQRGRWCWKRGLSGRLLCFLMLRLGNCYCYRCRCCCHCWWLHSYFYIPEWLAPILVSVWRISYELLCCFFSPTTSPITNPTIHSINTNAINANLFQPPLFAIYLLLLIPFLTSNSFSPCGPSTPLLSN